MQNFGFLMPFCNQNGMMVKKVCFCGKNEAYRSGYKKVSMFQKNIKNGKYGPEAFQNLSQNVFNPPRSEFMRPSVPQCFGQKSPKSRFLRYFCYFE